MKKLVISILFVLIGFTAFAQTGTGFSGKVIDSKTQKPLQNVIATIQNINLTEVTNAEGKFVFKNVPVGNQLLLIRNQGYKDQLQSIDVEAGKIIDLGLIVLDEDITEEQQLNLVTITETELSDENSSSESTAGLLQATRDVFLQAAAYNFGQARFSVRGIDNEYSNVMINGITMNRVADGRPQYGVWGGLNDATRNQEFTNGSAPSDYTFGGIAGTQEINTRASNYRKGTRLSFLNTNTNYSFRMMGTHVSGMNKDGWAYVVSAGRRWAQEGYFEGTNYDANSFFASVEKKINEKHSLNFTSILAQNKRGKNSPNTQEVSDLAGIKYNSYWGYQNGEKRNSRFKDAEEPIVMLTHYWKPSAKTNINTTVSYQTGKIGNSRFDFLRTDNPDPIYYTNLPSYLISFHNNGVYTPNLAGAEELRTSFLANKQVNWDEIIALNKRQLPIGSRIVLYEDRNDEEIAMVNTNIDSRLSDNITLNAGANYMNSHTRNFKNMLDLLGGTFYNTNGTFGFGEQNFPDVNNPDRNVGVGEKYGYNYNIDVTRLNAFTQFKFTFNSVDFYLAQSYSRSGFQREGLYKNGFYPSNSFGKSDKISYDNFGFKGGLTYKITGQHLLDFNAIYMSKAPNAKDVFANARVNNVVTDGVTNDIVRGFDASYIIKAPKFKARFTGFLSETLNATDINFYYSDAVTSFVSEAVTGINKKNRGAEVGLEYQITSTIKLTGIAAYGEYTFTNNPLVSLTADDGSLIVDGEPVFPTQEANMKGYKQAGMPQQAYSFGVEYRDPKFWWIGANVNYLLDNYIDVSTLTRTNNFYTSNNDDTDLPAIVVDQDIANELLKQEKFNPFTLVNLVGGKSWRFNNKYTLGLFANVNNVLDQEYKTGGFEQARSGNYRQLLEDRQGGGRGPFAPKYFYGYGRTYTVNLYLQF